MLNNPIGHLFRFLRGTRFVLRDHAPFGVKKNEIFLVIEQCDKVGITYKILCENNRILQIPIDASSVEFIC
jgi:hypothetical protein